MPRTRRRTFTRFPAPNRLVLGLSIGIALFATVPLSAGEPREEPPERTGESIDGSWLFDWMMRGKMGVTSWKQVRMRRDGTHIHLERLTFEQLGEISETSTSFDVLSEWQDTGRNGILLLRERKPDPVTAEPSKASPENRYAVWVQQSSPDRESGMTILASPSLLEELATPDEAHARRVFEANKLALTRSKPLPLSSEVSPIPFRARSELLESVKLPPLPVENPTALAELSWHRANPFSLMLSNHTPMEVEGGAVGAMGMMAYLMGIRDHASFVERGFSPLSGRVARLYWAGGNLADPIGVQRKFEEGLGGWLGREPKERPRWEEQGPGLEQFRKRVTTAFKKGDPDLIMALFEWKGVDQFSKDSEFASWRQLFLDLEYETEKVQLVRPDEVFRRFAKLEMDGWSSGGNRYHPNVEVVGAVSINLAPLHIQIPFGLAADGKWALAGIVCDQRKEPEAEDRAPPSRPDSLEVLHLKLHASLESGDVEAIMGLYDWKGYTPFQKDRERFAWTELVAIRKARRGVAEETASSFIAFEKRMGRSEEETREQIRGELEVAPDEGQLPEPSLEKLVLAWVIQDWEDIHPSPQPSELDGSNFGFEVEGRQYHGLSGELLLFGWRPSSNQNGEMVHQVGAGQAQDGGYVLCPIVLPKRIQEDFSRLH